MTSRAARILSTLDAAHAAAADAARNASEILNDRIMDRVGTTGAARLIAAVRIGQAEADLDAAIGRRRVIAARLAKVARLEARRLHLETLTASLVG